MVTGVHLGIDVGTVRVGIARSDASGMLATPLQTAPRENALDEIVSAVDELGVVECVVGLPLALSGHETASTRDAQTFAETLAERLTIPVRLVDERLTTVSASAALREGGKKAKRQRPHIDQAAAVIILQHLLDAKRHHGNAPGRVVMTARGVND